MTTSFGYTDKLSATKNVVIPQLSYSTDFSVRSETPNEVILTNVTSPLDQPETLRFGIQPIRDIYSGTAVDPTAMSVSKQGLSLVVQMNDILRVTPDEAGQSCCCDGSYMDFPISTHIVIRTPVVQYVTADVILSVVKRNIAAMFGEGPDVTSGRLNQMLRGALKPSTM